FHRVASSWLGDLFVVVPGQWRRIIGSSRKGATPKFKKLFKRSKNQPKRHLWVFIEQKRKVLRVLLEENPSTRLKPKKRGR
ncbi:hypothetical protein, partial [Serratia fonticola]|uniref:hypothetical protein n=1 Tax=Serratia fonticola TaxID=47917 RepID=UPI0004A42B40